MQKVIDEMIHDLKTLSVYIEQVEAKSVEVGKARERGRIRGEIMALAVKNDYPEPMIRALVDIVNGV